MNLEASQEKKTVAIFWLDLTKLNSSQSKKAAGMLAVG